MPGDDGDRWTDGSGGREAGDGRDAGADGPEAGADGDPDSTAPSDPSTDRGAAGQGTGTDPAGQETETEASAGDGGVRSLLSGDDHPLSGCADRVSRRSTLRTIGDALFAGRLLTLAAEKAGVDPDDLSGDGGRRAVVNVGLGDVRTSSLSSLFDRVHRRYAFDAASLVVREESISRLRRRPGVRYVEPNAKMTALGPSGTVSRAPGDRADCLPWGIDRVDAEQAHEAGYTGSGADVAVVDTGIDARHEDLTDNLGEGEALVEADGPEPWHDDAGHGTHCAGTVAADGGVPGVAPDATLHAVKVLDSRGVGSAANIAAGIEWAADAGCDVVSLSLGSPNPSRVVADACEYARDQGAVVVAAAGNSGPCEDCVGYPAANDEVIAVSATDDGDGLARFSSTGPEVELAAPGAEVTSTVPGGHARKSGTSMACPHVSGAAALLAAEGVDDPRERLGETAEDLDMAPEAQGEGLLDAAAALGVDSGDDGTGTC